MKKSGNGNGNGGSGSKNGNGRKRMRMAGRGGYTGLFVNSLPIALAIAHGEEEKEENERLNRSDLLLRRQRQQKRSQGPPVDIGLFGHLDPEKILLVKEFIAARAGLSEDHIFFGVKCEEGLSGIMLSPANMEELADILCS